MTDDRSLTPFTAAFRITEMLDQVFGVDRFDKEPFCIKTLALEYSKKVSPNSCIVRVESTPLNGFMGALVHSDTNPRKWGILCDNSQSDERAAFTLAHEFGHFLLHRHLLDEDPELVQGIYCDENSILRRNGTGIEQEADTFAANLLMPRNDFEKQIHPTQLPTYDQLGDVAKRYGVSLTAAILRWLEFTKRRIVFVVSTDGFALWSKSSKQAFKSYRFIKTRQETYELPTQSVAAKKQFTSETMLGVHQNKGIWFPESVTEMCLRSTTYNQEMTILDIHEGASLMLEKPEEFDTYDQFQR